MSHKLGICIPYRNRLDHLQEIVPYLTKFLTDRGIDHKFYVAHQVDDKLLNRGALKNIAAKLALADGCDYIAWHDVDMLPQDDCDYTYPQSNPVHIATKLSKYNYGLGYDQYFGGVILFTKEQIERTNGYSNEYWDWGQEDDDLFWRCHKEGYTTGNILNTYENKAVANFNGDNSYLSLPVNREITSCLHDDHAISILFKAQQQPEKNPIWLIGDKDKKFIEYPILRKEKSWTWGLSFNNSNAVTMMLLDENNGYHYNWGKRGENLWTWVTMTYSKERQLVYFYINDKLVRQLNGVTEGRAFPMREKLKHHLLKGNLLVGYCSQTKTFLKGQVAEIKIWNTFTGVFKNDSYLVAHYDFTDGIYDRVNKFHGENNNVELTTEDINVIENILPYRREGSMLCLPHPDEGFNKDGWIKGETTARNEKRFVTEMLQGKINHKKDGINSLQNKIENVKIYMDNCLMINTKLLNG